MIVLSLLFFIGSLSVFYSPAEATTGVDQDFRNDMGGPRFDANKTTRFQINETNGNLYIFHHLMTIPNQRGLPLNLYLTYNSQNFDSPAIFGKGCWSFSLCKRLEEEDYSLVNDPGDWAYIGSGLEAGDILEECPELDDFEENPIDEIERQIEEAEESLSTLEENAQSMEEQIEELEEQIHEIIWAEQSDGAIQELRDTKAEIEMAEQAAENELASAEDDYDAYSDTEIHYVYLRVMPNYQRDGSPHWMPQYLWEDYQELGGNDEYKYSDEMDLLVDYMDYLDEKLIDYHRLILEIDNQIWLLESMEGEYDITSLEEELNTLESDLKDINKDIKEVDDQIDKLKETYDILTGQDPEHDFEDAECDIIHGANYIDGEGDGFFIYNSRYSSEENPMHVDVEVDANGGKLTFKDGRVYNFSSGRGRILSAEDRYGNETTFEYVQDGIFYLTGAEDCAGRRVELSYQTGEYKVESITVSFGGATRVFSFTYDEGNNNLIGITNPEGETTEYDYYSPDEIMMGPSRVPWLQHPIFTNKHILKKVTDPRGNSIRFEYDGDNYTRVWKDSNGIKSRETEYEFVDAMSKVLITDSRGNVTSKYRSIFGGEGFDKVPEQKFITRITDPFGKDTKYEFDTTYFYLNQTEDTNTIKHTMTYDTMGNMVLQEADAEGYDFETEYTYEPAFNQVSSITDANNHTRYFYYVANGSPAGYGSDGVLWKETDAEGNDTLHWYNQFGQRIKTEDARGNITGYSYDETYYYLNSIKKYTNYPSDYYEQTFTYDWLGNKLSGTDLNGNLTEYDYDVMNRLTAEKVHEDGSTYLTTYYYDVVGNRTEVINPRGFKTKYEYDGFDRLIKVKEAFGETEEKVTEYGYDTEDNKVLEIDPNGNETTFKYDALNRLIEKNEPLGKVTKYEYNGEGDSSTNDGSRRYNRSKDRYTKMSQYNKNYRGGIEWLNTKYDYDSLYRLKEVTDPMDFETSYGYDAAFNKTSEIDGEGRETIYQYDDNNRLKKIIDPYAGYIEYWYDAVGNKERERDKNGNETDYEYDELNRPEKVTDAESGELRYQYDGMNKTAERDKNGNWTSFSYNDRNLLTNIHYPISGIDSSIDYDEAGNKTGETDPNGNVTKYDYNGLNRLTKKTEAYGDLDLETEYEYDDNGNRTSITDAEDNVTDYKYDALNRLTAVWDPINGSDKPTKYFYDLMGNKVLTSDANKNETEYYYDKNNRLKKVVNAKDQVTAEYEYDDVGNRIERVDAENQKITYQYDDLNRLTTRTFEGISKWITYSYDASGNRTGMVDSTGTTIYIYDDINRLISVITPGPSGSKTVGYTYYPNGERETLTDPDSGVTEYEYDDMNRLISLTDPDDGVTEYEYDAGSRLVEMVYPSGAVASYDQYDAANRLIHLKTTDSTQTAAFTEFTYVYDNVGNRTAMSDLSGTTAYGYDDLYRLTSVSYPDSTAATYYYDAVGNREKEINNGVVKDYVYNNLNQLVTWSSGGTGTATRLVTVTGTAFDDELVSVFVNQTEASLNAQTYTAEVLFTVGTNVVTATAADAAGNTASSQIECYYRPSLAFLVEYEYDKNGCLVGKAVDGTYYTVYEYDYENRLTRVTLPDASTNEFVYDGDKRRVSRKDASGEEKWFLYDGINILQDLATDGTVWTSYVQGIGIDKLISVSEWTGQTSPQKRYYHSDAIGSVRSLTDEDETEVGTYTYDAWGKVTSETGSSENEYKFTSRRWEQDLGLQYNRARFYDPETGRFITPDPLTGGPDDPTISYTDNIYALFHRAIKERIDSLQPHRLNRYVYCNNNPVNFTDPLGLQEAIAITDALRDFAKWRLSAPDLVQLEWVDWGLAGVALAMAAVIAGDIDLPEGGIPGVTIETGEGEGIPWSQEDADSLVETLEGDIDFSDWMSASQDQVEPGETQEGAKAEVDEERERSTRTPAKGESGTTQEFPDEKGGKTVRDYGENGRASRDIDYGHDHGAGDPHAHDWDWKNPRGEERGPGRTIEPDELP